MTQIDDKHGNISQLKDKEKESQVIL